MNELSAKNIFGYWHQGRDAAPEAIKRCWDLWARMNPGWDLKIYQWSDVESRIGELGLHGDKMSFIGISDIVRLDRLSELGGVWVDAYTVPLKPLDSWLPSLLSSGFFAYHDPYRRRLAETWFLASHAGHPLAKGWRDAMVEYWQTPRRPMRSPLELDRSPQGKRARLRGKILDRIQGPISARGAKKIYPIREPNWAVSPRGGGRFPIYPYFAMAMLFDWTVDNNEKLRQHFAEYPKFTSYDSQMLRHWRKRYGTITEQDVRSLCLDKVMQKLNLEHPLPDPILATLFDMAEQALPRNE